MVVRPPLSVATSSPDAHFGEFIGYGERLFVRGDRIIIQSTPSFRLFAVAEFTCDLTPGDTNCDEAVTVSDITAFVHAIVDPQQYYFDYPTCDRRTADLNGDGEIGVNDIAGFLAVLMGG